VSTDRSAWGRSAKSIGWGLALLVVSGFLLGAGQYQAVTAAASLTGSSGAGLALIIVGGILGGAGAVILAVGLYVLASNVDMLAADTARRLEAESAYRVYRPSSDED
jgi:hypothetical protein